MHLAAGLDDVGATCPAELLAQRNVAQAERALEDDVGDVYRLLVRGVGALAPIFERRVHAERRGALGIGDRGVRPSTSADCAVEADRGQIVSRVVVEFAARLVALDVERSVLAA